MADGWIELFDVETDEAELLFVLSIFSFAAMALFSLWIVCVVSGCAFL